MPKDVKIVDYIELDSTPGMPRYEQVKQAVRRYIREQNLRTGDKLPPETDLCKQFGLSRVTVNKALNELAWEGVIRRVRGSGTYIGASTLKNRIMVCSPNVAEESDFCSSLFNGIREEASSQKVDIVYETRYTVPSVDSIIRAGVDGVLIQSLFANDLPNLLSLYRAGIKFVCIALRDWTEPLPTISTNNFEAMTNAMNYLIEMGHSKIAYATFGLDTSDVVDRIIAFSSTLSAKYGPIDRSYMLLHSNYSIEPVRLRAWLCGLPELPTAIVLDALLLGPLLNLLQSMNLRVPEDISLLAVDDLSVNRHIAPKLTLIKQPVYQVGRRGIEKLMQMLRDEDDGKPEILKNELIIGDTVRKINAR